MMDNMMSCGGWGMGAASLLTIVLLLLGIAALAKYLFWGKG